MEVKDKIIQAKQEGCQGNPAGRTHSDPPGVRELFEKPDFCEASQASPSHEEC